MNSDEDKIRKTLDGLFEKAKTSKKIEDLNEFKLQIDNYDDEGYNLMSYIHKYNLLVQDLPINNNH